MDLLPLLLANGPLTQLLFRLVATVYKHTLIIYITGEFSAPMRSIGADYPDMPSYGASAR
jgi:hypothetical protein